MAPGICRDLIADGLTVGEAEESLRAAGILPAAVECQRYLAERGLNLGNDAMPNQIGSWSPANHFMPGAPALRHRQNFWSSCLADAAVSRIPDVDQCVAVMRFGGVRMAYGWWPMLATTCPCQATPSFASTFARVLASELWNLACASTVKGLTPGAGMASDASRYVTLGVSTQWNA